jgi:hypothetical protein
MEQFWAVLEYLYTHPGVAGAALVALGVAVYLLNLKPRYVREADEQLRIIRRESTKYRDAR